MAQPMKAADPSLWEIRAGNMQLRQLALGPALAAWARDIRPRQRCTAHRSTDGQPCEAWAVHGARVCVAHGGAAWQVRRAAFDRLAAAGHEALAAKAAYRLGLWPKDDAQEWAMAAVRNVGVHP
jgi:hypothetical protein